MGLDVKFDLIGIKDTQLYYARDILEHSRAVPHNIRTQLDPKLSSWDSVIINFMDLDEDIFTKYKLTIAEVECLRYIGDIFSIPNEDFEIFIQMDEFMTSSCLEQDEYELMFKEPYRAGNIDLNCDFTWFYMVHGNY